MRQVPFATDAVGKAWSTPAAVFETDEDYLIGIEITDMEGVLPKPLVAVFCICGFVGTKSFLTTDQAREFAAQVINAAAMVDAGARSMERN